MFAAVAGWGDVEPDEMFSVFNMGVGFVVVTAPADADRAVAALAAAGRPARVIGEVVPGDGAVRMA